MAEFILIYGKSGAGKTRSLCNFGEDEIFYVNVTGKRPPLEEIQIRIQERGRRDDQEGARKDALQDGGDRRLDLHHDEPLHGGTQQAEERIELVRPLQRYRGRVLRAPELHQDAAPGRRPRLRNHARRGERLRRRQAPTIGKLLDQKVCIEGLATIVLRCVTQEKEHYFLTRTDGTDITKSPEGMFEDEKIPNDLKAVADTVRAYYNETEEEDK